MAGEEGGGVNNSLFKWDGTRSPQPAGPHCGGASCNIFLSVFIKGHPMTSKEVPAFGGADKPLPDGSNYAGFVPSTQPWLPVDDMENIANRPFLGVPPSGSESVGPKLCGCAAHDVIQACDTLGTAIQGSP